MSLRVRFAPSPTGYLHVGGARTALFNWFVARQAGGVFMLRIEDTDQARSSEAHTRAILDGMRWLGMDWDEGPVFQSEGVDRHRADALRLLAEGKAYRDFADPAELAALRESDPDRVIRFPREAADALGAEAAEARAAGGEPHAIRFRVPAGETTWEDRVHGSMRFRNEGIEDLVILRSDGTPTYNLAVVSDDADGRITLVIRGDDHLSNTPKQILLHAALGNPVPDFAHVPMILGPDGKRLSKRHGATAVGDYRSQGILPEAMVNFLSLLGWNPGTEEEVFPAEELCERFSLDRVQKKSAVFDLAKLEWLNGRHLAAAPVDRVAAEVRALMGELPPAEGTRVSAGDGAWFLGLVELLKVRARTVTEIAEVARIYTGDEPPVDADAAAKHLFRDPGAARGHLEALEAALAALDPWELGPLEVTVRSVAEARGVGAGKLIHPLRVALTGQASSPGIFEVMALLGRERSLARIAGAARRVRLEAPEG
ncbi:MAG: glutamate--tRNA ligase [Gemmatimonadales bacterium]|nr:MAG: glutamate--tRNA ligase [Gemmatimonadales bacterium]